MIAVTTEGEPLALTSTKAEARIDSRLLARHLGRPHQSLFEQVKDHRADFEELGKVRFETGASPGSRTGQKERFVLLNEDQCYLLLTYSRNTKRTRPLKLRLVKAFGEARRAAVQHGTEYLPSYHQLHDEIHAMAAGSANEKFIHMNVNKLVNQVAGIESGQRSAAPLPKQALLTVAQSVATQAMRSAPDHRAGFQKAKTALLALSAVTVIGGTA